MLRLKKWEADNFRWSKIKFQLVLIGVTLIFVIRWNKAKGDCVWVNGIDVESQNAKC